MQTYTSSILSTLSPFLIAFLIAYFINPLVNRIDHILFSRTTSQKFAKLHKFLSLLLAYVIVIGFIALVLTFVIPQIVESILELIRQVQEKVLADSGVKLETEVKKIGEF